MIASMLLSGASGCALTLVDLQQRLADGPNCIYGCMDSRSIVEAFEEVLSHDLCDAVKAKVSVLYQSFN